jgi:hypothetical protein
VGFQKNVIKNFEAKGLQKSPLKITSFFKTKNTLFDIWKLKPVFVLQKIIIHE